MDGSSAAEVDGFSAELQLSLIIMILEQLSFRFSPSAAKESSEKVLEIFGLLKG